MHIFARFLPLPFFVLLSFFFLFLNLNRIANRLKLSHDVSLETKVHPEFILRHRFSLLVVGSTQCGKTSQDED